MILFISWIELKMSWPTLELDKSDYRKDLPSVQFSSVQSLSRIWLFATPWITARQSSLSITNSWSLPKPMSTKLVMPPSHLILCRPLLLLSPILPSIRVFPNESTLRMRWPKYWSFSFNISPSNEHPGLISFTCGQSSFFFHLYLALEKLSIVNLCHPYNNFPLCLPLEFESLSFLTIPQCMCPNHYCLFTLESIEL